MKHCFQKYIPETLLHIKRSLKYIVPVVDISLIISLCKLLESILAKEEVKSLEFLFVWACVWCLGAGFALKDNRNYRKEFSDFWKDKFKTVAKWPTQNTVFDYYLL